MKHLKKTLCLILTIAFVLGIVGCGGNSNPNPSDTASGEEGYRKPIQTEEKKVYEDNDHLFDYKTEKWDGPDGYVIVVPQGNSAARESAKLLQEYYQETCKVTLAIVSDNTAEKDKEILIGKTAREQSNKDMAEADLKVSLNGTKLVFDGGHDVTVDSAVKKYIRLAPKANETNTFTLTTDFKSSMDDGYQYVWGDEFEGNGFDSKNWDLISQMVGNEVVEVSKEKNVVDVQDGRLKLHALSYFNNNREGTEYRIPCSPVTLNKMNFVYGYMEIRARVPYSGGVWASWWAKSTDKLKGSKKVAGLMSEVDMYEIFNTYGKYSCIIKWYLGEEFDYNTKYNTGGKAKANVANYIYSVSKNPYAYFFEPSDKLNYEYHTYGWEWTKTEMKFDIDGKVHCTYSIKEEDTWDAYEGMEMFHDPHFVIFNNHIFHEKISTASASIVKFPESLPASHYIDYIRLYQKPELGELYIGKQFHILILTKG